ncbi:MAG TPA: FKBP-type peptidyl-prolyl cis-trans isomerase [Actinomycetota bacterium]|nr:FKBP-type peptidyl-prolyl cis-trans isomerase [Actinomycetota bacterium]
MIETDSGLKYEEIECGDGAEAARGDTVSLHYTGTLEDGEEFDSSEGKDPLTVRLGAGEVIAGFEEGLIGMHEGGTRELTIPPELGYGPSGFPPAIPPDATLVFEIRLLEVDESGG